MINLLSSHFSGCSGGYIHLSMEEERLGNRNGNENRENNGGCKTLEVEGEICQTNFKSMRFFQSLFGDFLTQLGYEGFGSEWALTRTWKSKRRRGSRTGSRMQGGVTGTPSTSNAPNRGTSSAERRWRALQLVAAMRGSRNYSRLRGGATGTPSTPNAPNRRTSSAGRKRRALHSATARRGETPGCFSKTLKACHLQSKRFCLPSYWVRNYLAREAQDIELRVNEKIWTTRFNVQHLYGAIIRGWLEFAEDNSLQESDVCLFKLGSKTGEPVLLDVRISRACPTPPPAHELLTVQ